MCMDYLRSKIWRTKLGTIKGATIASFLKTLLRIIKSVLSRCLYVLYTFIAVWRVTEAIQEPEYWLLLLTLCPLAIETVHAVLVRRGNEMKWMTPSVFFYLLCGIPCVWLLELKLVRDRLLEAQSEVEVTTTTVVPMATSATQPQDTLSQINSVLSLSDEGWTLALEQILIFVLVLGKWIGPKGELSRDEFSQLLLVNIAAGADIVELLEVFGEEEVSQNREIVYMVLSIWSWSLLQFGFVLTATKDLPSLENTDVPIFKNKNGDLENMGHKNGLTENGVHRSPTFRKTNGDSRSKTDHNTLQVPEDHRNTVTANQTLNYETETKKDAQNNNSKSKNGSGDTNKNDEILDKPTSSRQALERLQAEENLDAFVGGRRCFDCFCCYTEIWGMVMSIAFQDGPFLIIRLFIMLHYKVVTHMNVFFTCKNVLVILLLLNRIRVIVLEERTTWDSHMREVKRRRDEERDEKRRELGFPPRKSAGENNKENELRKRGNVSPDLKKPRWVIWRA